MFYEHISSMYGALRRAWLEQLPTYTQEIAQRLGLRDLQPAANLTYNYLLLGWQKEQPIVLKISFNAINLEREHEGLCAFRGYGAVEVLHYEPHILLIHRLCPGSSLQPCFPLQEEESLTIAYDVMRRLHQAQIPERATLPSVSVWLKDLDKAGTLDTNLLQRVRSIRDHLLESSAPSVLLHGDLHHDNILQDGARGWIAIDPKGVIGEPAFESGAFIRNPIPQLLHQENVLSILEKRILFFARSFGVSRERIRDWSEVQAALCGLWAHEDGGDVRYWLEIIQRLQDIEKGWL